MANFEYKNIDEILEDNNPKRGVSIPLEDLELLEKNSIIPLFKTDIIDPFTMENPFVIEFHTFFKNLSYVKSNHNIDTYQFIMTPDKPRIKLQIHKDLENLGVPPSEYKVVYNFLRNLVGSETSKDKLFISEISNDRREIKLSISNPNSQEGQSAIARFVIEYLKETEYLSPVVLNFGENKFADVINVSSDGDLNYFYVKLYEPLPRDINLYYNCWVSLKLMKPYIDTVILVPEQIEPELQYIAGPNFEVDYDYWITSETDYKSWTDILSENVQTSEQILQRYISSSSSPVVLNVDYGELSNFIHFSSAEDRIDNFVYKSKLLEFYRSEISRVTGLSGSVAQTNNKIKLQQLRDKVVADFDGFEKYLYYETSGSSPYTYQISASILPYPKYEVNVTSSDHHIQTKEGKFKFYSTGSTAVESWYTDIIEKSRDYDFKNYNKLTRALPEHISEDYDNEQVITFVNMLGQHFDIMFLYTDHILKKNLREENPKSGLSQDLIYDATRNLGWTLSHGTQGKDLWEYALGLSGSGEPIWTGKTTANRYLAKTYEERTKEVWRRILNNLPYIYKTKGTARGIKALLAAYGIPQTILSIREFGGPDNADLGIKPRAEWEKHTYFLNFSGSYPLPTKQHHIRVPWEKVNTETGSWQYPETLTFRWKMEPNDFYEYALDPTQTLLQKNSGSRVDWFVTMAKNGSDVEKGSIYFYIGDGTTYLTASITDKYFYDDVPLNLMIRRSASNDQSSSDSRIDFIVETAKYGKSVIQESASLFISGSVSSSINRAWVSDGTLYIGSGSNSQTNKILSGSVFELRYWSKLLNRDSFTNHVLAPRAYNGNTDTSSYHDLQAQWKFWQPFDVAVTTSLESSHPNQSKNTFYSSSKTATFYGFDRGMFEPIVETYNMEVATVGNNTPFSEKVRIDSGSLIGSLDPIMSSEVSSFDKFSLDTNKLMVAFSPQHTINEDIYESIGNSSIDDYFGEYSNVYKDEYPRLKWFSKDYWKKYPNKNDFSAYIKLISIFDFSVFDQIRQTLPARVNEIVGLVVEPNVLERSKVKVIRGFSGESPEKTVMDTTELYNPASSSALYTTHKTKIVLGFDNDSEYQELSGEHDIPLYADADSNLGYNGDVNREVLNIVKPTQYYMSITSSRQLKSFTKPYNTTISNTSSSFTSSYVMYNTKITTKLIDGITAENSYIMKFGKLNTSHTNTWERTNIQTSSLRTQDVGYGAGWITSSNESGKSTAIFKTIQNYFYDSYYSGYKFTYTSSRDIAIRNYSSSSFVTSSLSNPQNLTTSLRNHRFEGCKLTGPDINVDTRNTPDGKAVVEVFIVSPDSINADDNFGSNPGGNLSSN